MEQIQGVEINDVTTDEEEAADLAEVANPYTLEELQEIAKAARPTA